MFERIERWMFLATRISTLVAILASWFGAILLFALGLVHTYEGFAALVWPEHAGADNLPHGDATVVHIIGALDRFLIAVVLLYFGYGLYGLFIRPDRSPRQMGLPEWLHVDSIGELKQTTAEVIIVILFVLFLRYAFDAFQLQDQTFTLAEMGHFLALPVAIVLLAGALRLAELHPKSKNARRGVNDDGADEA